MEYLFFDFIFDIIVLFFFFLINKNTWFNLQITYILII